MLVVSFNPTSVDASDISWGYTTNFEQLQLEPQKASDNFIQIHNRTPEDLQEVRLVFHWVEFPAYKGIG